MTASEVRALAIQLHELRERVVKLEMYVKLVGALVTIVPTIFQVLQFFRK